MKSGRLLRRALLSNLQFLKSGVEKLLRYRLSRSLCSRIACNPLQGNVLIHACFDFLLVPAMKRKRLGCLSSRLMARVRLTALLQVLLLIRGCLCRKLVAFSITRMGSL